MLCLDKTQYLRAKADGTGTEFQPGFSYSDIITIPFYKTKTTFPFSVMLQEGQFSFQSLSKS